MDSFDGAAVRLAQHLPQGLRELLSSRHGRIYQVYQHIFVFNINHVVHKIYKQRYQIPKTQELQECDQEFKSDEKNNSMQWHDLPKMHPFWFWYRVVSSIYMTYVVLKNTTPNAIRFVFQKMGFNQPIHCYMLGRFANFVLVGEIYATCFAMFHLVWRMFQVFDYQPLAISTFYFLILDDRDILLYYKLLDEQSLQMDKSRNLYYLSSTSNLVDGSTMPTNLKKVLLSRKMAMMHDIMSFKMDRSPQMSFKLRSNRTVATCKRLRDYMTLTTVSGTGVFILIAIMIATSMLSNEFDDRWHLKQYSGCDPELEQMVREGSVQMDKWSFQGTHFQFVAFAVDLVENWFLWSESGIVYYSCITCTLLLNYDLKEHWRHLDKKIDHLIWLSKVVHTKARLNSEFIRGRNRLRHVHEESIFELQMEIRDFFKNLRRTDLLVGDVATTVINVWFTLFAYFIYSSISSNREQHMSLALVLTILAVFIVTSLVCLLTLSVHRLVQRSYGKLCSLMALDESRCKHHFTGILDFFVRHRTSYTIYRGYEMTTTTYLSIIGYSFSCFFILCSVNKNRSQ